MGATRFKDRSKSSHPGGMTLMNLVTLPVSPARMGDRVKNEVRSLARTMGSRDEMADDLLAFARGCFLLRLAVFKFIEIDNLMHRKMAVLVAEGKKPPVALAQWETVISGALRFLQDELRLRIRVWKRKSLERMKKVFGFGLQQLVDAEQAADEFLDALRS